MTREDRRRRMRIARRAVGAAVLPIAAPATLRALSGSWRIEKLGREHYDAAARSHGWIATMWHGRMLLPLREHAHTGMSVLVSPSDDGSLVQSLLTRFGYRTIRGSSNKSPAKAIRRMLARLEEGGGIVITPDGPRGPRHRMNPGPVWMARETGYPILPVGFGFDRAWSLHSWDRFTIPKPRARVVIAYAEPIHVDANADDDEIERLTEHLSACMLDAERSAFEHIGAERDW